MSYPILDPGLSIFTGFGDDIAASIKFSIIAPNGRMPSWSGGRARVARFQPLHSNDVIKQYTGRDERVLTVLLEFASFDDYDLLDTVQGRSATLRYRAGITNRAGASIHVNPGDGVRYYVYPGTELAELTEADTEDQNLPQATATFRRPVGIGTLYDYAHYAEEDE